jgi:hypothetical protein
MAGGKNLLKTSRVQISAPSPKGKGYVKVYTDTFNGAPRIVLNTGDPNEKQNKAMGFGKIEAPMDLITYMAILTMIEELAVTNMRAVAEGKVDELKPEKYAFDCLGSPPGGGGGSYGQKQEPPVLKATVHFGRGEDKGLYISVISANSERLKAKVPFAMPDARFHKLRTNDGQPASLALQTAVYARAWVNASKMLIPHICNEEYETQPYNGGQRGGQPQRNQPSSNSGGGDDDFGGDIPF